MKTIFLSLILLISFSYSQTDIDSANGGGGIIYGNKHAFFLIAPKGWVLDNSSGVSQGLHAVFYPIGGSWSKSPVVMYANTASKEDEVNSTRDKLIEFDINHFKQNDPKIKIKNSDLLMTKDNKKAIVKLFIGINYEAVAYIEEESTIILLTVSANSEKQLKSAMPAFKELVSSYSFITTDVKIDQK